MSKFEDFLKNIPKPDEKIKEKQSFIEQLETLANKKPETTKYRIAEDGRQIEYSREEELPKKEETQFIPKSGWAMAGENLDKKYLLSFGAGPCVIVTLHDPEKKIGALTHLDSRSNVLVGIKEILKDMGSKNVEVRIVGGHLTNESSQRIVSEIRSICNVKNLKIVEEDVLADAPQRRDVGILFDASTGQIFDLPKEYYEQITDDDRHQFKEIIEQIDSDEKTIIGGLKKIN